MRMERPFRVIGISHIGIAPKDLQTALSLFKNLGLNYDGKEDVTNQKTTTHFLTLVDSQEKSDTRIELLEQLASEGTGPIQQFLEKKGGGIHHIALQVDSVANALAYLKQAGVKLIDEAPRVGAHGCKIAFIHPHAAGGILVELTEEPS